METYGELLQRRLVEARRQHEELVAAIASMRETRRLAVADDEHDPEGSTVSLDQARHVALLEQNEQTLTDLAEAHRRWSAGDFGRCEGCGEAIPAERLEVRPDARVCVPCARRRERPPRLCR